MKATAVPVILGMCIYLLSCDRERTPGLTKVSISKGAWMINGKPVLAGSPAEGLLVNVRMVNAVFEDEGPLETRMLPTFNPDENTSRFIHVIPNYVAQGVRAFTIGLQGGYPGYEGAINSAFNADGSLRQSYLDRVARVIHAANRNGAVIILSCFYQRQHSHARALEGKQAVLRAIGNVAKWIADEKYTNVVLEVSNEFSHGGFRNWKDGEWIRSVQGQVALIEHAKAAAPSLLVSTSGMGSGMVPEGIARAADYIVIHFNNTPLDLIPERVELARKYGKPVVCNEDDKTGPAGAEAARLSIRSGAAWGFMHSRKNQTFPFSFTGAADDTVVYQMFSNLTKAGSQ